MKGIKRIIGLSLLILTLMVASVSLMACNGKPEEQTPVKGKYDYVISAFDSDRQLTTFLWRSNFGRATTVSDAEYVLTGEKSAKLEIYGMDDIAQKPNFTMYTDTEFLERIDYREATAFELNVYNDYAEEYSIYMSFKSNSVEPGKGGYYQEKEFKLKPKEWNKVVYELDRVDLNKNWGIDKVSEFKFRFDNLEKDIPVLYFDSLIAKMDADALPEFNFTESRILVEPNADYTIPVESGTKRAILKYNEITKFWEEDVSLVDALTFKPTRANYKINYIKEERGYKCVIKTVNLVAEKGESRQMLAKDCVAETDRPNTGYAHVADDKNLTFISESSLLMQGARFPERPYGFTWNTGYTGGLNSVVLYIYNMRDIETQLETKGNVLWPKKWNRVEYTKVGEDTLVTQATNWKNGSVIKRNSETGEWSLFISILMWDEQYEMYFDAIIEKSDTDTRVLTLKSSEAFINVNETYELETFSNANWTVTKDGVEIPGLKNATSIKGEEGEYKVNYVKDFGNNTLGRATFTLYCDKYDESNSTVYDVKDFVDDGQSATFDSTITLDSFAVLGKTSFKASLNDTGMNLKNKTGIMWNSHVKGEIKSVIFYIYNHENINLGLRVGAKERPATRCLPKSWTRIKVEGDFEAMAKQFTNTTPSDWDANDGSSQVTKNAEGEWLFQMVLWKWDVNFNFNFHIIVNT